MVLKIVDINSCGTNVFASAHRVKRSLKYQGVCLQLRKIITYCVALIIIEDYAEKSDPSKLLLMSNSFGATSEGYDCS